MSGQATHGIRAVDRQTMNKMPPFNQTRAHGERSAFRAPARLRKLLYTSSPAGSWPDDLLKYGAALACVAAAAAARWAAARWLQDELPFITFFPAVILAAWYGGWGPALAATAASAAAAGYFFVAPVRDIHIFGPEHWLGLSLFVSVGLLSTGLIESQRTARLKAEAAAQALSTTEQQLRAFMDMLQEQRKWFEVTLASIGDAVIVTDTKGRVTFINPVASRLTGWEFNEALGRDIHEVFHIVNEQTRSLVESPVTRVLREGVVVGLANHTVLIARGGGAVPIDDSGAPIRNGDQGLQGVVLVFRDISQRRLAEQSIRARLQQQATVAELGQKALAGAEPASLMDEATRAVCQVLGVEFCKVLELLPEGKELLVRSGYGWPEGVVGGARVDAGPGSQAGHTLRAGGPVIVHDLRTEKRFRGTRLLHDNGVISGLSVVVAGHQRPFGILGAHSRRQRAFSEDDIAFLQAVANTLATAIERGRASRAISDSEERARAVLDTAADGILTIDEHGLIESCNPAALRIFGYSAGELIGRNVNLLMPSPYREEHNGYLANYLRTGQKKIIGIGREVQGLRKNGTIFPLDLAVSEVRLGNRRLFTGIVRDVTERNRAEQTIREQKQEMEDFLSIVAHDLKHPVVSMQGLLSILGEELKGSLSEDGLENFTLARVECERMRSIIAQLAHVSRIGREELVWSNVHLPELIDTVMRRFSGIIQERHVEIRIDCPAAPLMIARAQVEEALENLVENAIHYGCRERRAVLDIRCALGKENVSIAVTDHGPGIAPQYHERVFEVFRRLDPSGPVQGTGVGLAAVQRLMRHIGGTVTLESDVDQGATFTLRFPARPPGEASSPQGEENA
jgi:PAS domain S-box-containing protein